MLIGLSSKNAILIVEFAEQLQETGLSVLDAGVEAATDPAPADLDDFTGLYSGSRAPDDRDGSWRGGRVSVGTTVVGGMIAATTLEFDVHSGACMWWCGRLCHGRRLGITSPGT